MTRSPLPTIVTTIAVRVFVDPIRSGLLRRAGWPPGLTAIVGLGLLGAVVSTVAIVLSPVLRRLPLTSGPDASVPGSALTVLVIIALLAVAVLLTGALHAPLPVRLAGLLATASITAVSAANSLTDIWTASFWVPVIGWLGMIILSIGRRRKAFVWWEFVAVYALLLIMVVTPLGYIAHSRYLGSTLSQLNVLSLLLLVLAAFAIPVTMLAGLALADVAMRTALWTVDVLGRELPGRAAVGAAIATLVLALGWAVVSVVRGDRPGLARLADYGPAGLVLITAAIGWVVLDRIADRRRAESTRLAQLPEDIRPIAVRVAIATSITIVAAICTQAFATVLSLPIARSFPGLHTDRWALWLTGLFASDDLIDAASFLITAVGCLVVAYSWSVRARRGEAELLMIIAVLLIWRGLTFLGLVASLSTPALGGLTVVMAAAAAIRWVATGRMSRRRWEAVFVAALLGVAVGAGDVLGDPAAALLGLAGGAAVWIGLVWTLLTGSADANDDSPAYPRPTRVLLVIGNAGLGAAILAVNALLRGPGATIDLEQYVDIGRQLLGTALLLAAALAVFGSALRDEEIVERVLDEPQEHPAAQETS